VFKCPSGAPNDYYKDWLVSLFCHPIASGVDLAERICKFESPATYGIISCFSSMHLATCLSDFGTALSACCSVVCIASDALAWSDFLERLRVWTITYGADRYLDFIGLLQELEEWLALVLPAISPAAREHLRTSAQRTRDSFTRCRPVHHVSPMCNGYAAFSGLSLYFPFGMRPRPPVVRVPYPFSQLSDNLMSLQASFECIPALRSLFEYMAPVEAQAVTDFAESVARLPAPRPLAAVTAGESGAWIPRWKREQQQQQQQLQQQQVLKSPTED
jgi:hypothetical protein